MTSPPLASFTPSGNQLMCTLLGRLGEAVDLVEKSRHLYRRDHRLAALVSHVPARASPRLFDVVRRDDAERDRQIELASYIHDAARRLARNKVEVRRLTADHRAGADDR